MEEAQGEVDVVGHPVVPAADLDVALRDPERRRARPQQELHLALVDDIRGELLVAGVDAHALKEQMLALLHERGAQYPAEHNVGHLYKAPDALKQFYRENDPTNSMNPGIGKTTRKKYWKESAETEEHNTQASDELI